MSNIFVYTYVQNSSRTFVKRVSHALSSAACRRRRRRGERRRRRRFPHPSATCLPTATARRRCCRGQISPGQGFFVAVLLVVVLLLLTLNPLTIVQKTVHTNKYKQYIIIQARDIIVCIKYIVCAI